MLTVTTGDFANLSLLGSPALGRLLEHARIVPTHGIPPDVITMYSLVLCIDLQTRERQMVRLVYPADVPADEADISVLASLGMALLGASAGQEIKVEHSDGSVRHLRVAEVLYQPEHDLRANLTSGSVF